MESISKGLEALSLLTQIVACIHAIPPLNLLTQIVASIHAIPPLNLSSICGAREYELGLIISRERRPTKF